MYWYSGKLVEGELINLKIDAPELCYGGSVFSTMRVYGTSLSHPLTAWAAHCDRLKLSLQSFAWQEPDWQRLKAGAKALLDHFLVLRIAIFPDGREWITGRNLPADLPQRQTKGITAWIGRDSLYRRELAEHKTGNYLGAYLARNRALSLNAQEAILIDNLGNWLETSTGNLWGWRDGCWYTPSLDSRILPGIGRSHLLNVLRTNNYQVEENVWTPDFVSSLEAIAYSNCVVESIPIKQVRDSDQVNNYAIVQLPPLRE